MAVPRTDKFVLVLAWLGGNLSFRQMFRRWCGTLWLSDEEFMRLADLGGMPHDMAVDLLIERNSRELGY